MTDKQRIKLDFLPPELQDHVAKDLEAYKATFINDHPASPRFLALSDVKEQPVVQIREV